MNRSLKYGLSNGIRLFVCSMAVFFTLLSVFDSFVQKPKIVYAGEFVSEADFEFIDLPNTLQFPSGNKISKIESSKIIFPFSVNVDSVLDFTIYGTKMFSEVLIIFLPVSSFLKYSLNSNAP